MPGGDRGAACGRRVGARRRLRGARPERGGAAPASGSGARRGLRLVVGRERRRGDRNRAAAAVLVAARRPRNPLGWLTARARTRARRHGGEPRVLAACARRRLRPARRHGGALALGLDVGSTSRSCSRSSSSSRTGGCPLGGGAWPFAAGLLVTLATTVWLATAPGAMLPSGRPPQSASAGSALARFFERIGNDGSTHPCRDAPPASWRCSLRARRGDGAGEARDRARRDRGDRCSRLEVAHEDLYRQLPRRGVRERRRRRALRARDGASRSCATASTRSTSSSAARSSSAASRSFSAPPISARWWRGDGRSTAARSAPYRPRSS